MSKTLFAGNLAYAVTDDDLRQLFSQAGTCKGRRLRIDDANNPTSRGCG
jgi:RNA recognition motif-containing protein